jgi:hypothetical protein
MPPTDKQAIKPKMPVIVRNMGFREGQEMSRWPIVCFVLAVTPALGLEVSDTTGALPDGGVFVADLGEMSFRVLGSQGVVGNVGGRKTQFIQYLNMSEGRTQKAATTGADAEVSGTIYQSTIEKHDIPPWETTITELQPRRRAAFTAAGGLHSQFTAVGEAEVLHKGHSRLEVTWTREPAPNVRMSLVVYIFKWLRHHPLFIVHPDGTVVDELDGKPLRVWASGDHGVFPAGTRIVFPVGIGETAVLTTEQEALLSSFNFGQFFGGFSITPNDPGARQLRITVERFSTSREVAAEWLRAVVDGSSGAAAMYYGPYKLLEQIELIEGETSQRSRLTGTATQWDARASGTGATVYGNLVSRWTEKIGAVKSGLGGGALCLSYAREDTVGPAVLRMVIPPVHVGQPLALASSSPVRSAGGTALRTGAEGEAPLSAGDSLRIPLARGLGLELETDADCRVVLERVRSDRAGISFHFADGVKAFSVSVACGPRPGTWPVRSYTERDYVAVRAARPPVRKGLSVIRDRPRPGDVQIVSPYWTVTHSGSTGGAISQIEYVYGRPGGVLNGPVCVRLGEGLSSASDRKAALRVLEQAEERVVLRATGDLCSVAGLASAVGYETAYEYRPTYMVRTVKLTPEQPVKGIARLAVAEAPCVPSLNEFVAGRRDPEWGRAVFPGTCIYERRGPPEYIALFERDVQCLEFFPRGNLTEWTDQLSGTREDCRWAIEEGMNGGGVIRLNAYDNPEKPITLDKPVEFSHFVGLPQIPKANREKHAWHMLPPGASDEEVRHLAYLGVDSVHGLVGDPLMTGRDSDWERVRTRGPELVAKCHEYGLPVVPYLFFLPMRDQNSVYVEHWDEWRVAPGHPSTAVACTVSEGWRAYYRGALKRMMDIAGYDGVYYDFVSLYTCENVAHGAVPHSTVEGLMKTLEFTREIIGPDGIIIGHRGHQPNTVIDAYLDGVVVFEHYSHPHWLPLDELTPLNTFVGASRRDTCTKSLVCSLAGLNPRDRREEGPRPADTDEILVKLALQGLFPYSFHGWPEDILGRYFRLYELFRSVDFDRLTFADSLHQSAVRGDDPYLRAAVYFNEDEAYLVIANPECDQPRTMSFAAEVSALGWEPSQEYVLAEQPEGTGIQRLTADDLARWLSCEVGGYGYRVYVLRPLRGQRPQVVASTHKWWETEVAGEPAVITRGPVGQECTLKLICTKRPREISLNRDVLAGDAWTWDQGLKIATVTYNCQATNEPHSFVIR